MIIKLVQWRMSDWDKDAGWLADGMGILAGDKFRLERVRLEERNMVMALMGTGDLRLRLLYKVSWFRLIWRGSLVLWFDLESLKVILIYC